LHNAAFGFYEQRAERLAHSHDSKHVGIKGILDFGQVQIESWHGEIPSGIVDQVVQLPAGEFGDILFQLINALLRGNVELKDGDAPRAQRFDLRYGSCGGDDMEAYADTVNTKVATLNPGEHAP
jgi:hypothetical protein